MKFLTCLLAVAGVALTTAHPALGAERIVRQPAVPVDVRVPVPPTWIPARDGAHALYELHLAVYRQLPLELERVDVLDAADGTIVESLTGEALQQALVRPGRKLEAAGLTRFDGGDLGVLFVDLHRPPGASLPTAVRHDWYFRRAVAEGETPPDKLWLLESAAVPIAPAPGITLGPPLSGAGWLAANGLGSPDHRRTLLAIDGQVRISQRYAIDFVKIGDNGRPARREPAANGDFFGYGANVLAVADGRVVAVADGVPDNDPQAGTTAVSVTLETIAGNHVTIDIGGAFVTYAHLQPGSATVAVGQQVKRGDVIGKVGNSGNSDAPHLHLQVTDGPDVLASEGLPFVFGHFGWQGEVTDLDAWIAGGEGWQPAVETPQPRRDELPLAGDVIAF